MTTLLCWNVAGRVKRIAEQLERIVEVAPDIICLQEVTATTAPVWSARLPQSGWPYVRLAVPSRGGVKRRPLRVLTAARLPVKPKAVEGVPWTERVLSAEIGGITYLNVHSPISAAPGLVKVLTHEALYGYLSTRTMPGVLCGDLNTPRREHSDGRIWTFARTQHGKLRPERGERWDNAELGLLRGLEVYGWRDVFRQLHGPEIREISWSWARWEGGYRLDHLIASSQIHVARMAYIHAWRTEGLSDHSALVADLELRSEPEAF